jgi:hypothetical protein
MDPTEIKILVEKYGDALREEFAAKGKRDGFAILILHKAVINGKNAEARKQQADEALAASQEYKVAVGRANTAEVLRRVVEAEIGLFKAYLTVSQEGISRNCYLGWHPYQLPILASSHHSWGQSKRASAGDEEARCFISDLTTLSF